MTESEYREVGRKFGKYAKANKPSPSQMQAYLSDHLVDDDALVAMKEVVTRADFHNLLAHTNTTNSRASLDSLLSELTDLYSPRLVASTRIILEEMLDYRKENTVPGSLPGKTLKPPAQTKQNKNESAQSAHRIVWSEQDISQNNQIERSTKHNRRQGAEGKTYTKKAKLTQRARNLEIFIVLFGVIITPFSLLKLAVKDPARDKMTTHPNWAECRAAQDVRLPDRQTPGEVTKPLNRFGFGRFPPKNLYTEITKEGSTWWSLNCGTIPGIYDW